MSTTTMRQSKGDRAFDAFNYSAVILFTLLVLYPLYVVVISSVSDPTAVALGQVALLPQGFTLEGYRAVFEDSQVWQGYLNSVFYTVFGTSLNVVCTVLAGYALSRKDLIGGTAIMLFLIFTMYFEGGLIPTFLLVRSLGLYGSRLALIVLDAVWVYLIIIARTYYRSTIPDELREASVVDGCTNVQFFWYVVLPLSAALTAVLALFYGVAHWNQYFKALIYLRSEDKWPLQLVLHQILVLQNMIANDPNASREALDAAFGRAELVKYSLIIVASVPMMVLYPFVQRYFVKGVMIGSVKG
ncbi:MAG: carbohydrate ABC transporter permease [Spirochaetales bacterium]